MIKTHQQKTKIKRRMGGGGVNVDTHTHSTDWLLHLLRMGWLWITVQFKIRRYNQADCPHIISQQTVHVHARSVRTRPDTTGWLKTKWSRSHLKRTRLSKPTASMFLPPSHPVRSAGCHGRRWNSPICSRCFNVEWMRWWFWWRETLILWIGWGPRSGRRAPAPRRKSGSGSSPRKAGAAERCPSRRRRPRCRWRSRLPGRSGPRSVRRRDAGNS